MEYQFFKSEMCTDTISNWTDSNIFMEPKYNFAYPNNTQFDRNVLSNLWLTCDRLNYQPKNL